MKIMTTGSTTTGAKDTEDGITENVEIANGKASNKKNDTCDDTAEEYRMAVENLWKGNVDLPDNWDNMTVREQRDWSYLQVSRHFKNVPKSLNFLVVGSTIIGDCGRSASAPIPDWLDSEKFLRGQRFATNNWAGIFFAEMVSLCGIFSFENALKPLIITGKSSDPFASFERYRSTAIRVKSWYTSNPWIQGTPAYENIQTVRRMHAIVRNRLINSSLDEIDGAAKIEKAWSTSRSVLLEDFGDACPAAAPGQCPYAFDPEKQYKRPKGMNQSEMAATQCGFICFTILYPEYFGIHGASEEDLEAFCHVWRSLGYLLGVEDEFNFCNGTLEEVKQRCRDFVDYWMKPNLRDVTPEWEHMLRCLLTGLRYYSRSINFEIGLLYFADLLDIRLTRFEASVSYSQWLRYKLLKITFRWIARLPWGPAAINRRIIRRIERSLKHTQEELEELRKQSNTFMTKGIEETTAGHNNLATLSYWDKNSFFVLSSTCLLLSLPFVVKR